MTHEEIDAMWQQSMRQSIEDGEVYTRYHFAKMVADKEREAFAKIQHESLLQAMRIEREACAKVCEDGVQNATDWDSSYWDQACENRAAAIRSRGQA